MTWIHIKPTACKVCYVCKSPSNFSHIHFVCFLKAAFDHPCMSCVGEEVTCRMMTHMARSPGSKKLRSIAKYSHSIPLSFPSKHTTHLQSLKFPSHRTRCQQEESRNREMRERERELCMCDVISN